MRMKFEIEPYEDMLDEPFEVSSYFLDRINMYIEKNNRMEEFCTSTFHSSILLDLAEGLINMYEQNQQPFVIEMFESTYEYTFTYFQKLLTITRYEGYNGETIEMMKCRFDDFVEAFVKEYERYHKAILKQDSSAFKNEDYCIKRDQINILKNHVNGVI